MKRRRGPGLAGVAAGLTLAAVLAAPRSLSAQRPPDPLATVSVTLPPRASAAARPVYTLEELCAALTKASGREHHADVRARKRRLLLCTPSGTVNASALAEVMTAATGLRWRTVGDVTFLALLPPDPRAAAREKMRSDREKRRRALLASLRQRFGSAIPFSDEDLLGGARPLSSLDGEKRRALEAWAAKAEGPGAEAIRGLLQDPNAASGARVLFRMDMFVQAQGGGSGSGAAHSLFN